MRAAPLYAIAPGKESYQDESKDGDDVDDEKPKFKGIYPWIILSLAFAVRILYQWQRTIFSYAYGYTGTGI
jgi:hypothetical protein